MSAKIVHHAGERFGRLVVLSECSEIYRHPTFWCRCDCGEECIVRGYHLRQGKTKSCGCLQRERSSEANTTHGHTPTGYMSPTYMSWSAVIARTTNPNSVKWPLYGGRGITVCDRWRSFESFLKDMGERPEGKTIDRIDVNGNYEPGNCRWATPTEQNANRRPSRRRDEARDKLEAAFGGLL